MEKLKRSLAAKCVAVLLFCGMVFICAFTCAFAGYALTVDAYAEDPLTAYAASPMATWNARRILIYNAGFSYKADDAETLFAHLPETDKSNLRVTVTGSDGRVLATNTAAGEELLSVYTESYRNGDALAYELRCSIVAPLTAADAFYTEYAGFKTVLAIGPGWTVGACLASFIAGVLLFCYLIAAAGWRRTGETPRRGFVGYIPFDLLLLLSAGIEVGLVLLLAAVANYLVYPVNVLAGGFLLLLMGLLVLLLFMTFAVRVKTHTFWRNNVGILICIGIGRLVGGFLKHIRLLWKVLLAYFGFGLLLALLLGAGITGTHAGRASLLFALLVLAGAALASVLAVQLEKLQAGAKKLSTGELGEQIPTKGMVWDVKKHAEYLNSTALGMSRAVEARMKSERMKTDLITNVSHDLKTPLTSIVNYVDLLKKEDLHNETASGYVEVLDRQAQRLKKLTTDLVEASKASSGVLRVETAVVSVNEILEQSLAEYQERFAKADLSGVCDAPAEGLYVTADGRLLWRAIDNLMNNALKYSLPGTRVYIAAQRTGDGALAQLSVKNVSREPISQSPDELTERFVRGDRSRASEGSGLGLAIAKSLTELMHGQLRITADGDLFRADIFLPVAAGRPADAAAAQGEAAAPANDAAGGAVKPPEGTALS